MTFEVTEFTVIRYKVLLSLCCTSYSSFKLGFPRKQRFKRFIFQKVGLVPDSKVFQREFLFGENERGISFFFIFLDLLKVEVQCSVLLSVHTEEKLSYSCAAALCR